MATFGTRPYLKTIQFYRLGRVFWSHFHDDCFDVGIVDLEISDLERSKNWFRKTRTISRREIKETDGLPFL